MNAKPAKQIARKSTERRIGNDRRTRLASLPADEWNGGLPPGFTDIDDYIAELERDPVRKEALDRARARLRALIASLPPAPVAEAKEG